MQAWRSHSIGQRQQPYELAIAWLLFTPSSACTWSKGKHDIRKIYVDVHYNNLVHHGYSWGSRTMGTLTADVLALALHFSSLWLLCQTLFTDVIGLDSLQAGVSQGCIDLRDRPTAVHLIETVAVVHVE